MDAEYGEVEMSGRVAGKTFHNFRLLDSVEDADNADFRHGEITVPADFLSSYSDAKGIHIRIPYTPDNRLLTVRIAMESGSGGVEYVRCAATSKCWFPVMQEYGDGTRQAVTLPSLYALNEDGLYNLLIREDCLVVYSGEETDFGIGASKMQNGTFLLKAVAGNLYQHPTTGVGLIDFLHSNMENNGLAAKLQAEFGADKVVIKNAYIDSATGNRGEGGQPWVITESSPDKISMMSPCICTGASKGLWTCLSTIRVFHWKRNSAPGRN
jgi:hypothetical protein